MYYKHSQYLICFAYYKALSLQETYKQMITALPKSSVNTLAYQQLKTVTDIGIAKTTKFFIDLHQPKEFNFVTASHCLKRNASGKKKKKKVILEANV